MELAQTLANAGPSLLLALVLVALAAGKLIFPRELNVCKDRVAELTKERDKWERYATRTLDLGEEAVRAAVDRGP